MTSIPRRNRVERTTFRNLRKGSTYYLTNTSGPFVKMRERATLVANVSPYSANGAAGTAVSDTSVAVQKVAKYFLGQKAQ